MNRVMTPGRGWLLLATLLASTAVVAADEADVDAEQRKQGERWFKGYDTDVDGFISREEYLAVERKKAEKRFAFIDTTKDGYLSANEAIAAKKKMNKLRGISGQTGDNSNETAD